MDQFQNLAFLEKMFSSSNVYVGRIKNTNIYIRSEFCKNKNKEEDFLKVSWYHNKNGMPRNFDKIHVVDILEMVDEEISNVLIFNLNVFSKRS